MGSNGGIELVQPRPLPSLLRETFVMLQEGQLVIELVPQVLGCVNLSFTSLRVLLLLAE